MQQPSRWQSRLHMLAYVLWGVSGFMLLILIVVWTFDAFGATLPLGIPDDAFEPLTMIATSLGAFTSGLLARWGSNHTPNSNRTNVLYPSRNVFTFLKKPESTAFSHSESHDPYPELYLQHIIYQHRYFDVKGLSTQGPFTLQLNRVFVELSVAPRSFHEASANPIEKVPTDLQTGTHTIWQFMNAPQMQGLPMAIIGPPGSGKTTLMKNISLAIATRSQHRQRKGIPKQLPVLLFLRYLAPAVAHVQNNHRYAAYETALETLKIRLGLQHPRINEFHIYEQRLRENIYRRRFGDNDTLKSERNEVVTLLNELAMETVNTSFNDLIDQQHSSPNNHPHLDNLTLAQAIADASTSFNA